MTSRLFLGKCTLPALLAAALAPAVTARAAITSDGDVSPANPSTWTTSANGIIGNTSLGVVWVNAGSDLLSYAIDLGLNPAASGSLTIDGPGASCAYTNLNVGNSGMGYMAIVNGGSVDCNWGSSVLGRNAGSNGKVTIDGNGAMWNSIAGVTVGYAGAGTLNIVNGGSMDTSGWDYSDFVGYRTGATGTVTVDGPGSTWFASTVRLYVGSSGSGALSILNGGKVSCGNGSLGGSAGTATIDGIGSLWTVRSLNIGNAGILTISHGGKVVANGNTTLGANGAIIFASGGGTLATQSFIGNRSQVTGTGTIICQGAIDGDVLFDANHGLSQALTTWNGANQNITILIDLSGVSAPVGNVGAGYQGTGSLTIRDGVTLTSKSGYVGYLTGASGTATVAGTGSMWTVGNSEFFSIGYSGNGTLNVLNGGGVSTSALCYLGYNSGSSGTVTIDGSGSTFTTSSAALYVGNSGTGILNITNGGRVTTSGRTYFAPNSTTMGSLNFGPNGGTLTTGSLYVAPSQVTGTGTINTHNLVIDADLQFDAGHGLSQTLIWNGPGQHVTVNFDLTGSTGPVDEFGVGYRDTGSLTIRDGVALTCFAGHLGYQLGSMGVATVSGSGSKWIVNTTFSSELHVGDSGSALLNIVTGGSVDANRGYLGYGSGSTGTAIVDGTSSTWTLSSLSVGHWGSGTLYVTHGGLVSASSISIGDGAGAKGVATVDGPGSKWTSTGLTVGSAGPGTLNVMNGGSVVSSSLIVGYYWPGYSAGTGILNINSRGTVEISTSYLGRNAGTVGAVTVDGVGAIWTTQGTLYVGYRDPNFSPNALGVGTVNISNGGKAIARTVSIANTSLVAVNVGDASLLDVGAGSLTNDGILRFRATTGAAPGTYSPITAGSWFGTGTTQALGGTWDTASHTFTVSPAARGTAGQDLTIDRSLTQRIVITDPTAPTVQIGFLPTATPSSLIFDAHTLTSTADLLNCLPPDASILNAWTFFTFNYLPGDPVFLSLQVGPGRTTQDLALWQFDGNSWSPFSAPDLSYDGTYANFTVTSLTGFAVTTPVPEPTSLLLLTLTAPLLLLRRRRHH